MGSDRRSLHQLLFANAPAIKEASADCAEHASLIAAGARLAERWWLPGCFICLGLEAVPTPRPPLEGGQYSARWRRPFSTYRMVKGTGMGSGAASLVRLFSYPLVRKEQKRLGVEGEKENISMRPRRAQAGPSGLGVDGRAPLAAEATQEKGEGLGTLPIRVE